MNEWLSEYAVPLALLLLLVANLVGYVMRYHGADEWLEHALEAAEEGDSAEVLRWLERLVSRQKKYSPTSLAAHIVWVACEYEHPETAQAVLDRLGLRRAELLWEEEGKPAIPFLEFLQREPEQFAATIAFLSQEDGERP